MNADRFDPEVARLLVNAEWSPERRVSQEQLANWQSQVARWCGHSMPEAARVALVEFGGLTVGDDGRGIHHARSQMRFDPTHGDTMEALEELIDTPVYPVSDFAHGHGVLGMEPNGTAWADYLHITFANGPSLDALIGRILLGLDHPPDHVLRIPKD